MNALSSLGHFIPELIIISVGFAVVLLDLFLKSKKMLAYIALVGLVIAAASIRLPENSLGLFYGFFTVDPFSVFFKILTLIVVIMSILVSLSYSGIPVTRQGEFLGLMVFISLGLIMMASSTNLLMLFLSIEFVSLTSYILTGFEKEKERSNEASLKYLLFGSGASAIMLFGISLLFGLTGSIEFMEIKTLVASELVNKELYLMSMVLILAGFAFKISAAPFHMWAPDVYTGAPTPVTAFLTVAPKALGFAVMLRALTAVFDFYQPHWTAILAILAFLTMTFGNIIALSQSNIKRLLAYSSIAQVGYILMGVLASTQMGFNGVLYYLLAYAFTNIGAFAVAIVVCEHKKSEEIDSFKGLNKKSPLLAVSMLLFLVSLAGLPPLAGYIGKFLVFAAAIQRELYTLSVIAAINSAIAAFYYFKIVKVMFLTDSEDTETIKTKLSAKVVLIVCSVAVIILGIFPAPFIALISGSTF